MKWELKKNWVVVLFILSGLHALIFDLLVIFRKAKPDLMQVPVIYFSFIAMIFAALLIKNKYWILAFVFDGLRNTAQIIASKLVSGTVGNYTFGTCFNIAVLVGMFCMLFSLGCFVKLLLIPDLFSKKNAYKWMISLDDYFAKKFHKRK